MALVPCPECRKEVSERAVSCPSCGFPMKDAGADTRAGASSAAGNQKVYLALGTICLAAPILLAVLWIQANPQAVPVPVR